MSPSHKFALLGAGDRGRAHLREAYRLRDQEHLGRDPDDDQLASPQPIYDAHAGNLPDWVEDVSDLEPSFTAIYDPSADAREGAAALCQQFGDEPRLFDSYKAFLEKAEFDAVIVASPNYTHLEMARPLLKRGEDVLCEKPLATTLEDYDEFDELASASAGVFYTAFNMRSHPYYRRLKELLEERVVGELGMISCREVRFPFPEGHYYTQEHSGGSLLEKNCHDFDLMNWVTEADPVRVSAFGGQHVFIEDTDANDHSVVIVEYDNGVRVSVDLCMYAPYDAQDPEFAGHRDYAFRGTEGILRGVPDGSNTWELITRRRKETYQTSGYAGGHGGGDFAQMRNFLRCLQGRMEPPATPEDAKKSAAIAIGAERAIREREIVEIDSNYNLL